ncbi:hypothetical protein SAMN05444285_106104 [Draconibacterium orientale]|uniref:DNA repair photolyase n=1 Tax=Draconibacterium orientale TaxID=1168034 RepID=X5D7K2_9BACT|nr:radical SAM protein [Draconibacterium orientale]AHW58663.1 hypothetical protein FH5T_01260 [Draconibacterium orientale]SET12813.1 hypothetical protein SAMN05444285_106104 [Draconibacterium orientale]
MKKENLKTEKMKNVYKGKAIYNPSGKAGEYSNWACNFYVGCSNECSYCYLKKGITAKVLGGSTPVLKKCFNNETHALDIFSAELHKNINELKQHGLFFSFTTDPMLNETIKLTLEAAKYAVDFGVPVKILTKMGLLAFEVFDDDYTLNAGRDKGMVAFGVTLTGHDELEPNAKSNKERIEMLRTAKKFGYKTFASIEPIIDFRSAKNVIEASKDFCDLFKIGLESGGKYDVLESQNFVEWLNQIKQPKIYLKESLQKLSRYTNAELGNYFVESNYNLFT